MSAINFTKDFSRDYEAEMTQVVNTMYDKYVPRAYTLLQFHNIDQMIMNSLYSSYSNYKGNDLRKNLRQRSDWFRHMMDVVVELKTKLGNRQCNDCNKMWYDCRNTCYKPKTNPRPIEFPQDVFNVVKDYLGVYDIPEPVSQLMGMMKLKNLRNVMYDHPYGKSIKKDKKISVDERVRLYNAKVVHNIKNGNSIWSQQNEKRLLEIANKYPEFRFGKELTDKNKVFLLKLLTSEIYLGVEKDGSLCCRCSLWEIMRGSIGISSSNKIPKKPKPYVMYEQEDQQYFEYDMENNPYDMFEMYQDMDVKVQSEIESIMRRMLSMYCVC
jgi:hypothetical protein